MTSQFTCGVLFEKDPLWLWSIRPNSWSSIFITGPDELIIRQDHPALFSKLVGKLVIIASTFACDYPSVSPDYMWINGTKCFIDMISLPPVGVHVYLMLKGPRRIPNSDCIKWVKVGHRNVGGVTNARGTFGIDTRSPDLELGRDLDRSIGSILDTRPVLESVILFRRRFTTLCRMLCRCHSLDDPYCIRHTCPVRDGEFGN